MQLCSNPKNVPIPVNKPKTKLSKNLHKEYPILNLETSMWYTPPPSPNLWKDKHFKETSNNKNFRGRKEQYRGIFGICFALVKKPDNPFMKKHNMIICFWLLVTSLICALYKIWNFVSEISFVIAKKLTGCLMLCFNAANYSEGDAAGYLQ